MKTIHILALAGLVAAASACGLESGAVGSSRSRVAEELAKKAAPIEDLNDPRLVSVIVLFAMLSGSAAMSSGVSAFLLRKRNTAQYRELQQKIAELQALEDRNDAMLQAMPDLILTFDAEGRYIDCSAGEGGALAFPRDLVIGRTVLEVFGDGDLHEKTVRAIARALSGHGIQVFDYSLPYDDNGTRYEARFVRLAGSRVLCICRDITERCRAEEARNRSLVEKEALLREIHHRVKNNMQIVSSLLSMQSGRAKDPYDQELFLDSQNRIRTMASVHDQLYRSSDFSSIPAGEYLSDLVSGLESSWSRPDRWIRAYVEADDTSLELDRAVPIGLIVNELVTNAFKYAFGPGESGTIVVRVRKAAEGGAAVTVADDGRGFPEGFDARKGGSGMGYTIINALVAQIGGDLCAGALESGGAEVFITIPPPARAQP